MSTSVDIKVLRGSGTMGQLTFARLLKNTLRKIKSWKGDDGQIYTSNKQRWYDRETGALLNDEDNWNEYQRTTHSCRVRLEVNERFGLEWFNEQMDKYHQGKLPAYEIRALLTTLTDYEGVDELLNAASRTSVAIVSTVNNPSHDGHIKLYQWTGSISDEQQQYFPRKKSWSSVMMLKPSLVTEYKQWRRASKEYISATMALLDIDKHKAQYKDKIAELAHKKKQLAEVVEKELLYSSTKDDDQARWDAEQAWIESAPPHIGGNVGNHLRYSINGLMLAYEEPTRRLQSIRTQIEGQTEHIKALTKAIESLSSMFGGELE